MTLVEMAVVLLLLGISLFLLAGWARMTRQEAKRQLAVQALRALDEAMTLYEQRFGHPPRGRPDGSADEAIAALLDDPSSAKRLDSLPAALRRTKGSRTSLVDPWGTPLRYITSVHESPAMRARVASNAGWPIFDSAGPDRRFGSADGTGGGREIRGEECLLSEDSEDADQPARRARNAPSSKPPGPPAADPNRGIHAAR
jgi:type II secretory pathway pseudopilin PulG